MSELLISQYQSEISKYIQYGGDKKETSIRRAFANLLSTYCKPHDLTLVDELEFTSKLNTRVVPDGTIKDALRLTHGYWEAKDESDDIDVEIEKKLKKGYPSDNILFEDSITAVLMQNGVQVLRVSMKDAAALDKLVRRFIEFERPELQSFRQAITQFKQDMPEVLHALRQMIDANQISNANFKAALQTFLKLCQDNINADIVLDDAREMLIQHILTEDIFNTVFGDTQFHRENNIARELQKVADTFFTGSTKKNTLKGLESYYGAIKQSASGIANHHEKQQFLKAIYENFYKVYNPKLADRLGVVYTPNEIVRFMIESTEALIHQHFNKLLISRGVEILDPATGTGTFITDLIEHFKHNPTELAYKYKNELHCNEVAILPYYIANLNIEFTYSQVMGEYAEFPNICFVDTLDNLGFKQTHQGAQNGFDFGMTAVNTERVKVQNAKKISVIIGNPPYNANQTSENDNNKNRTYGGVDKRIKSTYIAESTAQAKQKTNDMYLRFFRWASDRLDENGVITFITNRSFLEARSLDGFRKCVSQEFDFAYFIDLGGDIRTLSGKDGIFLNEEHTVFGEAAAVGIAMAFLVKKKNDKKQPCKISYVHPCDIRATRAEKFAFLESNKFNDISFLHITPDKNHNWIDLTNNDFDNLIPVVDKKTKESKSQAQEQALFKLFSLGVNTNRDEWVYDYSPKNLATKMRFFIDKYNKNLGKKAFDYSIKWSSSLTAHKAGGKKCGEFNEGLVVTTHFRPYFKQFHYVEKMLNHRLTENHYVAYGEELAFKNPSISINTGNKNFNVLGSDGTMDLHFNGDTQFVPLYRYDDAGNRTDNITDWGLAKFVQHYQENPPPQPSPVGGGSENPITKLAIFHYVYAVLHDPIYREKYALNLKREFPHVPFYADFWQWASWGEALMQAHICYEAATPFVLKRIDILSLKGRGGKSIPKAKLKADKVKGEIIIDEATTLSGIPPSAWDYKLGNRSALEWVLDQYKESKPKDPTIREKFNTYQFADYKEHVIDLLAKVCTVSVQTQAIVEAMKVLVRA